MVNSIKSRGEIKKNKNRDMTTIRSKQKVIVDAKKSSLSRVKFTVTRPERAYGKKSLKVNFDAKKDNRLNNNYFRKEILI